MRLSSWLRTLTGRKQTVGRRRTRRRLEVETLENRLTPAILVSLDASGNLTIEDIIGASTNDGVTIQSDTTNNQFVISDPTNAIDTNVAGATGGGTNTVSVPMDAVTGDAILVNLLAGDDALTIDVSLGDFAKTITYDGGTSGVGRDELTLQGGGTFANVTHTFTSASAGSVAVTGNGLISYSGLENPTTDNLSATHRAFMFNGGTETIYLVDLLGAPVMSIDSSNGLAVTFPNPTGSLTIDAGAGNDAVNINSVDGGFHASLTINGGTGDDFIELIADITFDADRNLDIDLQNDAGTPGVDLIHVAVNTNLQLAGTGAAILAASRSILMESGSSIITADGNLTLAANQQTPATSGASIGISMNGATVQSTGSGLVQLLGKGGSSSTNNYGVRVTGGSLVQSGSGPLQVTGTGGASTSSGNAGVFVEAVGSSIRSAGGNVQVIGVGGGAGASFSNTGVRVSSGQISAGGMGTVNVQGTGGTTSGGPNRGVEVIGGLITSAGGDVQVNGTGGAVLGTNGNNVGVFIATAGQISAGGTGAVTVQGTGSTAGGVSNHGVWVTDNGSRITSGGGNIQVTGTQGAGSGSFAVAITSSGVVSADSANIALIGDSMFFASTASIAAGANTVRLRQRTNGTAINVGGADASGVLGLTGAELDRVTAGTIDIGDSNAGTITISASISRATPAVMNLTTGGNITFGTAGVLIAYPAAATLSAPNGSITTPAGSSLNAPDVAAPNVAVDGIVAPGGASPGEFSVVGSLAFSNTDKYQAQLNGGGATSQYDRITVTGTANLGSAILDVALGFTPAVGQPFVIVDTSVGVLGTFRDTLGNPLNEGATFNVNGATFSISYAGGTDGKDVVLTALTSGPSLTIDDFSAAEGHSGSTTFTFTVTLSAPSTQTVTVNFATANGSATVADGDYAAASGTLVYAPGDTSEQVSVTVHGDTKFEGNDIFAVILSNAVNAAISDGQGLGTIVNDDTRPTVSIDDVTAGEGTFVTTDFVFTVSLSNPTSETVSINFQTFDGSATAGAGDYFPDSGTLTFAPGETTKTITVGINADDKFEQDDSFTVMIFVGSEVTVADDTGVGTILNDDATPTISINDLGVFEGNGGTSNLTFPVLLSNPSYLPITVDFATGDGSATVLDDDYQPLAGTLTFGPGQTAKTITVLVNGDTKPEPNETFTMNLSNPVNGTIADATGEATILSDDARPTLTLSIAKDWSFQTVDSAGDVGAWSSLAIGSDNKPRIAYEDRTTPSRNLKYASFDGVAWNIQTVHDDATDIVGQEASLALDSLNRPHIAYQNFSDTHLLYAHHNGTSWVRETANTSSYLHISLDVDSQNRPLVSSFDHNTFDLDLARRLGGTWSVESPDTTTDATGFYTSLAVDSADNPWITFVNGTDRTLTLASYDGTAWQFQTIDSGSDFRDTSLVLDSLGRPHVSYYDFGTSGARQDLKYAFFDGTAWTITTVDANNAGEHNSLALDSLNRPRIAYIGSGAARFASFDGNTWTTQFVGAQANYTSLALDENDLASISYYSTTSGDLVLASQATASMSENGGSTLATVTRSDTDGELTINLLSSDTTEATVVASIVLADGQATSAPFTVNAVDDAIVDGTQTATISASAAGYIGDTDTVNITDDDPTVTLSLGSSPLAENGGVATVTATLSAVSGQTVTVNLGFAGTAAHPADYARSGTSIVIPAGSTTGSVTLTGVDDPTDEADETIIVDIIGVTNGTEAGTQQVTATITDDDLPPSLAINDVTVTEGNAGSVSATFTISLSQASGQTVTVNAATADNSAVGPGDYTAVPPTPVSFAPGQTTRTFTVQVRGDLLDEINETFFVNLSSPVNATIGDGQGVGTITDDDGPPSISINDVSLLEGNSATTAFVFTVSLSSASGQPVSVNFATADGSATLADSDYQGSAGSVTFAPGVTSQTVTVLVNGDTKFEADETFTVSLSGATNATIADGQELGTIRNDDNQPTISINDVSLAEGNGGTTAFVFIVSLSNTSSQSITVAYATANGSAAAGSDYQATSGELTFDPGETVKTVTVLANGDRVGEPNETFFVNLSAATNATIADGQGLGTIVDDEPRISISDVTLQEGKKRTTAFTFTITLSAAYDQPVTMSYRTVNGTATTGDNDYVARTGTLTFAPGETTKTITIEVKGDSRKEADETFFLDLFGLSTNALFTKDRGIGTILNDD